MINPDSNFKLSKSAKTKLALMCKTAENRSEYKHMLIQAELAEAAARKAALKSKIKDATSQKYEIVL